MTTTTAQTKKSTERLLAHIDKITGEKDKAEQQIVELKAERDRDRKKIAEQHKRIEALVRAEAAHKQQVQTLGFALQLYYGEVERLNDRLHGDSVALAS